ncbi:MAG: extensin family protein [Sphingomonadales bacterium]|nr:extensin family protein [Sphingomonadales bacterium]
MVCGTPGLTGTAIPPILSPVKGCGLADGVKITHVSGIALSMPASVDCTTAKALKTWVDRGIIPAVGNRGGGVSQLMIAGSYVCRTRNHQAGAKVSEHGRGRAIDLAGIKLANGQVITVAKDWTREGKILKAVHKSACGPFGTVLGPKSDRFHHDHIHVDTARYRGGTYCK